MDVIRVIIIYLVALNLLGLGLMGLDKWKAMYHRWRIPEVHLFLVAFLGGSLGSLVGMYLFRHKTKRWYFRYGFPLILGAQLVFGAWLIGSDKVVIM
ncbi:MAG: DUF1294 domain-containing protein [Lachnospiraceae bacterium]|nr:DUF1294 domain-containing protein [Lachnospiraceae bacterium]